MTIVESDHDHDHEPDHLAGFELLGQLGKQVLRPGGVELTRHLLDRLDIGKDDDVVEVAAGRGHTARLILDCEPATYTAVDRDLESELAIAPLLVWPSRTFRRASVARTGLADRSFDVAVGEAILTMHPQRVKEQMVRELARLVRPGGRIGLHEVAFALDDLDHRVEQVEVEEVRIRTELTAHFKVAFNALDGDEWQQLLETNGFTLRSVDEAPLRLLEPDRVLADEGIIGSARFTAHLLGNRAARRRVATLRRAMQRNAPHLRAVAMVATRVED